MTILISQESIQKAINKIDTMDDQALNKLAETNTLAQPTLLSYIVSSAIEFNNDALAEYVILYFNYFMESTSIQGIKIKPIDDDIIDGFQDEFMQVLEEFMIEEDYDLLEALCGQKELLQFFLEDLNTPDENGEELEEEFASMLFIVGIALIGLINRGINDVPTLQIIK